MKLAKKLKKAAGMMLISAMSLLVVPTMAADYDKHWAKEAITKWSDYEVVTGYGDGIFKPNQKVKRSELAAFIVRVFGLEHTQDALKFTDVPVHAWYAQDVAKVSAAGIMQGSAGQFKPNGYATREEVAVTLVKAFELTGTGEVTFSDQGQIAAWAKEAVATLASNGYAKGQAGNRFAPKAHITRAEVVQLLDNIVEQLIHTPGTYNQDVQGNVVVNKSDTVLENMTIGGNLYLAEGIGLGEAALKNTEIKGHVFVSGGGPHSIHFEKTAIEGEIIVDAKTTVRLVAKEVPLVVNAERSQNFILTGHFEKVVLPVDSTVYLKEAKVETLILDGKILEEEEREVAAQVILDEKSVVQGLIAQGPAKIDGEGVIEQLKVQANGIITTIKPNEVHVEDGCEHPIYADEIEEPSKDEVDQEGTGGTGEVGDSSDQGGSGETGDTGGTDGSGDSSETPHQEPIQIQSMTFNDTYEVPQSIVSISKTDLTLDVTKGSASLPATIEKIGFTMDTVKTGDKVKMTLNLPLLGEVTLDSSVEVGGKVSYEIADLQEKLNVRQKALIQSLKEQELYEAVEAFLNDIGLSLETDYLEDGSIDTDLAITKMKQVLAYFGYDGSLTGTMTLDVENRNDIEETKYAVTVRL